MADARPFRFAVQAYSASSATEWRELARKVEDLGYSALHLADHYIGPGPALAATNHPVQALAAVPAMAMAAEATTALRIGSRVLCIDYHHPVVLAKELATLDLLSDGRLEAGLGAGWLHGEYDAMGIPFERAGRRIDRLEEVVTLLRACFADGEVEMHGEHVHAVGFDAVPKPAQRPGPPIMIGGGSPRVLQLAGRVADIVSINFDNSSARIGAEGVGTSTADLTAKKVDWVKQGAGERFGDIELEIAAYFAAIVDHPGPILDRFSSAFGLPADELADHPHVLVGPVGAVCEELERRRDAFGINYITVSGSSLDEFAPVVERLAGT
jgi:probable F420-dependent oxidoreductase